MRISIRTQILLVLSIISILTSWQGVQASMMAFERGDVCDNIQDSQVEIPVQIDDSNEPEVIENNTLSDYISYELTQAPIQSNENFQSVTDSSQQWALRHIEAMPSSQISGSGSQVLVAVLDTGIDRNHEDLAEKVVAENAGKMVGDMMLSLFDNVLSKLRQGDIY